MASRDRFPLEPTIEARTVTPQPNQGELFARIALRALPLMKEGPEDHWIATERTLH